STMADNEDPLAALRDAEILAVAQLPLKVVPQFIQRGEDRLEGPAVLMREEAGDVLKEEKARPLTLHDPAKLEEQRAASVSKSASGARCTERLTRESADEQVEAREHLRRERCDVAIGAVRGKVAAVDLERVRVDLAEPDALVPELF